VLTEAESMTTERTQIVVKWNKIRDAENEINARSYQRCYGPPFLIQLSGSGLVAPCGMLFNDRYAKFHIGNICDQRWWDIWQSDRYWEVMRYLASDQFDAQRMCGALCIQHLPNTALDRHRRGVQLIQPANGPAPLHANFV
jgi:MoaA/NifB/PqqE/SkfB family radical SAM enzyme